MGKGRAPCCDKTQVIRGPWSSAEDLKLVTFIQKHGHDNWRALPKQAGQSPVSSFSSSSSWIFLLFYHSHCFYRLGSGFNCVIMPTTVCLLAFNIPFWFISWGGRKGPSSLSPWLLHACTAKNRNIFSALIIVREMQISLQNSNLFPWHLSALDLCAYLFFSSTWFNPTVLSLFYSKKKFECEIFLEDENVSAIFISSVNPTVQVMFSSILVLLFASFFILFFDSRLYLLFFLVDDDHLHFAWSVWH